MLAILTKIVQNYDCLVLSAAVTKLYVILCANLSCLGLAEAFNLVRQKRYDLFQAAFDHISKKIDTIYKVGQQNLLLFI